MRRQQVFILNTLSVAFLALGTIPSFAQVTQVACGPCEVDSSFVRNVKSLANVKGVPRFFHPTDKVDLTHAACKQTRPFTVIELSSWLDNYAGTQKVNQISHGYSFENESPKLIALFDKLMTPQEGVAGRLLKPQNTNPKCHKVRCAMGWTFSNDMTGLEHLYLLGKFGLNASHYANVNSSPWMGQPLENVVMAASDLPEGLLPLKDNKRFAKYKMGAQEPGSITLTGKTVAANASINFFDAHFSSTDQQQQADGFHEIAHYLSEELLRSSVGDAIDKTGEWQALSGWAATTYVNSKNEQVVTYQFDKPECIVSQYGALNPTEDFAESMVAYRYNPELFKQCPKKYNFLKDVIFDGIEYNAEANCKGKKIQPNAGNHRFFKFIKYGF